MSIELALKVVVAPALVIVVGLVLVWRVWRAGEPGWSVSARTEASGRTDALRQGQRWGGASAVVLSGVVLAVAYALGLALVENQMPKLPPHVAEHTLFWLALLGALAGLLEMPRALPWTVRLLTRYAIAAIGVWLITRRKLEMGAWDERTTAIAVAGATLGVVVWWSVLDVLANRVRGAAVPVIVAGLAGASAPLLIFHASWVGGGNLAGVLGSAFGALALIAAWRRDVTMGPGGAAVAGLVFPGLLWTAWLWGYFDAWQWTLLIAMLASVLLAFVMDLPRLRDMPALWREMIRVTLVAVPATAIAVWAVAAAPLDEYLY
ncbi:MAG: hypothetical protein AAGD00_08360 [Planctomycetota bacterium]